MENMTEKSYTQYMWLLFVLAILVGFSLGMVVSIMQNISAGGMVVAAMGSKTTSVSSGGEEGCVCPFIYKPVIGCKAPKKGTIKYGLFLACKARCIVQNCIVEEGGITNISSECIEECEESCICKYGDCKIYGNSCLAGCAGAVVCSVLPRYEPKVMEIEENVKSKVERYKEEKPGFEGI